MNEIVEIERQSVDEVGGFDEQMAVGQIDPVQIEALATGETWPEVLDLVRALLARDDVDGELRGELDTVHREIAVRYDEQTEA